MKNIDDLIMEETKTLENVWKEHLESKGVKLPKKGNLRVALDYLYDNFGVGCHIDSIKEYVISKGIILKGTDPVQVRHLRGQSGWYIVKEDKFHHKLVSVTDCTPGYIPEKRASKLNDANWTTMKEEYGYACVNCGSKEGEPLRWDQTRITVLQQGHMDPRKDLTYDNCIPQCGFCNQQYMSKAVFNRHGFVVDFCRSGF